MKKRCDTCKWFGTGCFDKECNYPELEAWEPREEGIGLCSECKYTDLTIDEPPCDKCYGKTGHPKFKQRIEVKLEGVEEVKERLKRIIKKDQFLVGIVHPSYMEMHSPKIYYFTSDFCLEEGTEVLVEGDDGTRAWGRVFIPSVPFENEQIEFIRDMGEEIGRVVGIFTPFHKCEE